MFIKVIKNFTQGLINSLEARAIPDGAVSDAKNWITEGDKMVLRRGSVITGTDVSGNGAITGLHTAHKFDGTEVVFRSRGRKIEYTTSLTPADAVWTEVDTANILPSAANGEEISFADYMSLAGAQLWFGSPNSSLYKVMVANPGSVDDQYLVTKNYKGLIKIGQNRMFLWGRVADKTGVYGSYVDTGTSTTVTDENIGTADGSTRTFTDTLAFKSGGARRTCFAISVDAAGSSETFSDNGDGTLTGTEGGTGTINYSTGAISVTFNTAPTGVAGILCDYEWEDSTNTGIADFSKSSPRTAGQGFIFRQDQGGQVQNVLTYKDIEYCFHEFMIWALSITNTDTGATNLPHRIKNGIPNWRAAVPTGNGIYHIDDTDQQNPKFRLMTFDPGGAQEVIPVPISNNIDLADYRFDKGVSFEWGDYVVFACRHKDSSTNNRAFIYNKLWKSFDLTDYRISCVTQVSGALWAGDPISNNVYELFSGLDDDGGEITNHLILKQDDLGIQGLKRNKRLMITGEIGPDQTIEVDVSLDNGDFVNVGSILGSGSYVDRTQSVNVGAYTLGRGEIGGGSPGITAYNFVRQIKLTIDRFEDIKVRFRATGIGWAAISQYRHWDIRESRKKIPRKYR